MKHEWKPYDAVVSQCQGCGFMDSRKSIVLNPNRECPEPGYPQPPGRREQLAADAALRDQFAGLAMQAVLRVVFEKATAIAVPATVANAAYDYADAMMAERARRYETEGKPAAPATEESTTPHKRWSLHVATCQLCRPSGGWGHPPGRDSTTGCEEGMALRVAWLHGEQGGSP